MEHWDVIVVGGGPAGTATARALAEAGVRVLVLERGRFGRDKPCGEGLMPMGVTALAQAGLGRLLKDAPCFGGIRFHAGERVVAGRFAQGLGAGVRRARFDAELAMAAAAAGAEVRFGARVMGIAPSEDAGWRVLVGPGELPRKVARGREELAARVLVVADGARSPLARELGLGGKASGRVALVGHVRTEWSPWVDMYFEDGFELALTPVVDGELSVAALVERERARELSGDPAAWLAGRMAELGLAGIAPARVQAVRLGGRARTGLVRQDGAAALLVGDAGGAVDPIVGCGLSIALAAAPAAARAVTGLLQGEGVRAIGRYRAARLRLERLPRLAAAASLLVARRRLAGTVARIVPERAFDLLVSAVGADG